jgi:exodeoxyribonuclease V beta subunit
VLFRSQHRQLGPDHLLTWLKAQRRRAKGRSDEAPRRLDSDDDAIHMLTVHQAKGLQFPVVYLPQAADRHVDDPEPDQPFAYHDQAGRRRLDLGRPDRSPERAERLRRHQADEDGESLRHLYVALTRATCQVTAWWTPTLRNTAASALHRVLFAPRPGPALPAAVPLDGRHPRGQVDAAAGLAVQPMASAPASARLAPAVGRPPALRHFSRAVDLTWRRTSYSALTADAEHGAPAWDGGPAEADEPAADAAADVSPDALAAAPPDVPAETSTSTPPDTSTDAPADTSTDAPADPSTDARTTPPDGAAADPLDAPSPMADLPGGASFGSLVHSVFEHADPGQPEQVSAIAARAVARGGLPGVTPAGLATALEPGLTTPLGPIADGASLADIPLRDRLAELDFELPLAHDGRPPALADLADILERRLPADDPLAAYPARLRRPDLPSARLRGFLTGSIDAVLRVGQPARYLVVDYKTNRLAPPDEPLRLRHYAGRRLAAAMMASDYPLQALLYAVALHRFLRWRLPDFDPERHFGGIAYLFVRGMAGPDTPVVDGAPCGVFAWRPPAGLVADLDDCLAGRAP